MTIQQKTKIATEVAKRFEEQLPNPRTELDHENEYQLAVAVALSAQTTDKKVNEITPGLFSKYPSWESLSKADLEDVTETIRGVNFHKGKAQRLIKAGILVTEKFNGKLPKDINQLQEIPGIARKSANVILQELWGIAVGIVVDTHVTRVSNRLGLTDEKDAKKIEKDLMQVLPKEYWLNFSGSCVLHGRYTCVARKPKCSECFLKDICKSAQL